MRSIQTTRFCSFVRTSFGGRRPREGFESDCKKAGGMGSGGGGGGGSDWGICVDSSGLEDGPGCFSGGSEGRAE